MKKILAVLLVLAMVISVAPAAFAEENQSHSLHLGTNSGLEKGKYVFQPEQEGTLRWSITKYYLPDIDTGEYTDDCTFNIDYDIQNGGLMDINWAPIEKSFGELMIEAYDGGSIDYVEFEIKADCMITLELSFEGASTSEPGETEDDPIDVIPRAFGAGLDIEAGATVYYNIQNLFGNNLVLGGNVKVQYAVYDDENAKNTWHDAAKDENGNAVVADSTLPGGTLIAITNEGTEDAHVTLDSVAPLGTSGNKAPIELNKDVVTKLDAGDSYYYKWTAENNGILNVAVSGTNGWAYSIGSDNYHSNDETPKPNNTVSVKKGDEVVICVSSHWIGSDEEGAYTVTDITLKLTFELATGEKDNPDAIGEDAPGKVTVDNNSGYYYKWTATDDGKVDISFAGTNGWKYNMSVNGEAAEDHASTDENAAANQTIEVKKGDVIIIYVSGVAEDASEISVNLAFTKNVPDNIEINYTQEDKITGAGSFNIGEDDWEWVDVEDDVVDKAVLGEDGYYHLNSKDGPILFLDMAADFNGIGIKDMNSVGRAKYSIALPEGNYENGQYKAMIDAYLAAVEDGVVALTEELMDMMQKLAVHKNWVDYVDSVTEGKVKVNPDDAWMLLCKYAVEKEDDGKDEGNKDDGPVVEPDNKDNTEDKNDNKVPATADNSALMLSLVAMVVAMAGVAVVLTNKKKIA